LLIKIFTAHQSWYIKEEQPDAYTLLEPFLNDSEVQQFLQINRYREMLWFNKETFELFLSWMLFTGTIAIMSDEGLEKSKQAQALKALRETVDRLCRSSVQSNYQVEKFMEIIKTKSQ
jgi:hypothetical protein